MSWRSRSAGAGGGGDGGAAGRRRAPGRERGQRPGPGEHRRRREGRIVSEVAERHGVRVDVHLHNPGTLGTFQLRRRIASDARERGLQRRVTLSHAYSLGMVDGDELRATARALAEAGVSVMTTGPGASAMPPVLALRAEGGVRGNRLHPRRVVAVRLRGHARARPDDRLPARACTATTSCGSRWTSPPTRAHGRSACWTTGCGRRAREPRRDRRRERAEAVALPPERLLVMHDGRIVAGTLSERTRV